MTTIQSILYRLTEAVSGTDKELYTEDELKALFPPSGGWQILTIFTTGDVREGREDQQWVNGVVRKVEGKEKAETKKKV